MVKTARLSLLVKVNQYGRAHETAENVFFLAIFCDL
jgi:hypothetical protein